MSTFISFAVYALGFAAVFVLIYLHNHYRTIDDERLDNIPFIKPLPVRLYRWSFYVPFIWFIDDTEMEDNSIKITDDIQKANLQHLFNYRSWMVFRVLFAFLAVSVAGIIYFFMTNVHYLASILGVEIIQQAVQIDSLLILLVIALIISLIPNVFLKIRQKQYESLYLNDIPVIQTFIILMLKSDKPLSEVLYSLTKINTRYQDTFLLAYRKYIRNTEEGLDYLETSFKGTGFRETVYILRELGSYARKDSINILENNKKQIIEVSNQKKRQKDLTSLVFTQALVALPFAAVLLLALMPIVQYGFEIFNGANNVFDDSGL